VSEDRAPAPSWLQEVFGRDVREPRRLRWGFSHETWAASVGGRDLVATRMDDVAAARSIVERGAEVARRLAEAGLPSPVPDVAVSRPDLGIVVAEYVEGTPGIEAMGDDAGARRVGRIAGGAWARLASVDPSGLGLDDLWTRPDELRAQALEWLRGVEADLTAGQLSVLRDRVTAIDRLLAGRRPGFVHGDLVPVNLLVVGDGLGALLDLEAIRVGEPLLDAAWFSRIVRYHHRELEAAASDAFAIQAGIDGTDERTAPLLATLPSVRILEILGRRSLHAAARPRWLSQLRASTQP
jgi:aminoglycoside phosphotransferase (APT) family kinase protein